jgi:hypothetical protein
MKVGSSIGKLALAAAVAVAVPGAASADSISPSTFSATLGVGESVTIAKTVTITQTRTAPVDIFFLADTTGSMGTVLANVSSGFSSVVSALSGVASNIAFGVGEYKDVGDSFVYREGLDLTTTTASVQSALSALSAGGGGDLPEGNIFGLQHSATDTSWRAGSQRFVVWVGDAPGHNPSSGATEVSAIAALNAANVDVLAASATSGPGLNAACDTGDCAAGQANRIVAGAGGSFLGTFNAASISTQITTALTTGIASYASVGLGGLGIPAGVSVNLGSAIAGSFDRSIDRTFNFSVTFTGVTPGTYSFDIAGLLNGTTSIGSEHDTIVVTGTSVPEPASLALMGLGLAAALRRRHLRHSA